MRANHIPRAERIKARIYKLSRRQDENHVPSPSKGNPYWCCQECGIHDPELSIRGGRHFSGCRAGGIPKEIEHYRRLLAEAEQQAATSGPVYCMA